MGSDVLHADADELVEVVLEQFRVWLVQQRGLAPESVRCYVTQARPFLVALPSPLDQALQGLDAGRVTAFMLGWCRGRRLEDTDSDDGAATRVVKWLSSLGQKREELVRLGQAAREGRHAVVIHDVSGRPTVDAITAVLNRHDAQDIVYFGDWQTEDLSIRR